MTTALSRLLAKSKHELDITKQRNGLLPVMLAVDTRELEAKDEIIALMAEALKEFTKLTVELPVGEPIVFELKKATEALTKVEEIAKGTL